MSKKRKINKGAPPYKPGGKITKRPGESQADYEKRHRLSFGKVKTTGTVKVGHNATVRRSGGVAGGYMRKYGWDRETLRTKREEAVQKMREEELKNHTPARGSQAIKTQGPKV